MKKNLFSDLSKEDLHDAGTYFPSLLNHSDASAYFDQKDLDFIDNKSKVFNGLDDKIRIIKVIDKYFDLDKYADLERLERLEWATQLIERSKILQLLDQANNSYASERLQRKIFALLQNPIINSKTFLGYLASNNINDLTIGQLHTLSKNNLSDGIFSQIDSAYDRIDKEPEDDLTHEEIDLITDAIANPNIIENPYRVIASIDLSINDMQLKQEFEDFITSKRADLKLNASVGKFKDSSISSLIKHSVLQYLDLVIISNYAGKVSDITHGKYAEYLFPDYDSALDKFRDSTIRHSKTATSKDFIHELLSSINKNVGPLS
jgi:hypothetical protein